MCAALLSGPVPRRITRPYSKLTRLCELAAACGGRLTTFVAVAKAIDKSASRVTQLFGRSEEGKGGSIVTPEILGGIAAAFTSDGVRCEVDWLHREFDDFAAGLAKANPSVSGPRGPSTSGIMVAGWTFTEATALPGLVELRLHPPRQGNELPDTHYVDATLLFGTACYDYQPEDGEDPRTIAIALRKALLTIGSDSFRPLKGSMIGERTASEHCRRVAGGVEITGPAPDGTLDGDPIGEQHLGVVAGTNSGEDPFTVAVTANWGSFVVTDLDAPSPRPRANQPSGNKAAILNALVYKHAARDAIGRPLLAHATMRRPPEGDEPTP